MLSPQQPVAFKPEPPQSPHTSTTAEPPHSPAQSNPSEQLTPRSEQPQIPRRTKLRIIDERYFTTLILVGNDSWMQVRIDILL